MGITVGIDLGTTNCCVAVLGDADIPGREELISSGRLREAGGALVVTDRYRSPTTPSAVWLDPDGTPVVGTLAKQKAQLPGEPPPAMFFKRSMGTDQLFTAGHARITAQEASAHLLRHLRRTAEETLGVPVERAVVTVPAFFETGAKNATTRAGADAGLEIVQTLLEPVAAALAYVHDRIDTMTEPGTFLVYDLGGGTFDASVVTWDPQGDFDHRSFHGDRFLGGYDFDQAVVAWVAEQLPGFDLGFDDAAGAHAKLLSTLLVDAEGVKIELSRAPVTWFVRQGVDDCGGTPMNINLPVERAEFDRLVEGRIRGTIELCDRALELAGVAIDAIGDVVMVGGSSRIPLVGELLAGHYGRTPLLTDPDLCVAVGAALRTAAMLTPTAHIEIARPEPGDGVTDISGRVRAGDRLVSAAGAALLLTSGDGQLRRRTRANADGTFQFADVPLADRDNDFTVVVLEDGEPVDAQSLSVSGDPAPVPVTHDAILANDFSVGVRHGLWKVAGSGAKVPHTVRFPLYTADRGSLLIVPVYEGMMPIGEVTIDGLSPDLPVGTTVEVRLQFTERWEIEAEARVPSAGRTGTAVMRVLEVRVDSWERLRERFREIDGIWEEKRTLVAPEVRLTHGPAVLELRREVEELLARRTDPAKANAKLTALETAVSTLPVGAGTALRPPMSEFEDSLELLAARCDRLDAEKGGQRAEDFRAGIAGLRASGLAAHEAGNQQLWTRACDAAVGQIAAIDRILSGGAGSAPASAGNPDYLLLVLRSHVEDRRAEIRRRDDETRGVHHAEAARLLGEADRVDRILGSVDVGRPDALSRLRSIHADELQRFSAAVDDFPPRDVIPVVADRGGR